MRIVPVILLSTAILALVCAPVYAQWVRVLAGGIPRGPDGKPNLSAPAPQTADGHPDLSGVWEAANGAKYVLNVAVDLKPGDVSFQPSANALLDQRLDGSHSGRIRLPTACRKACPGSMLRRHPGRSSKDRISLSFCMNPPTCGGRFSLMGAS